MKPLKKNNTTPLPELLAQIAGHFSYAGIQEKLQALSDQDPQSGMVDLVVMGRFKAGKSSLINSILQKPLLPVGVLPVTAIITRISYAAEEKARVTTHNGKSFDIKTGELSLYVSESNNPENEKEVALVDIFTPAMEPFKNIRIIDTPGLGSTFKHNTEVTRRWYTRIGAALVVMNSTQTCSEEDRGLIETALQNSPLVYLVLSKTDLLSSNDLKEVVAFVKNRSKENLKKELKTFIYTVKKDESQFRETLIKEVLMPLHQSSNEALQSIYSHKLAHIKALTLSYLNITLNVRQKEADARNNLKQEIMGEQLKLSEIKQELQLIANNYKDNTRKTLEKEIVGKYKQPLTDWLSAELKQNQTLWEGNLNSVSRKYEQWLKEAVERNLRRAEAEVRPEANKISERAGRHITNYCNAFRGRLNHNLQKVLGVAMPDDNFIMKPEPVEKPDIRTSWAFESHIDLIWFLVPMALFRKAVQRHFTKQLPAEAEKNLYRLTAQFSQNVNKNIDAMHRKAADYITGQLNAMESLLNEKGTDTEEVIRFIRLLD